MSRQFGTSSVLFGTALLVTACAGSGELTTASIGTPSSNGTAMGQRMMDDQNGASVQKTSLGEVPSSSPNQSPAEKTAGTASVDPAQQARQLRLAGNKTKALKVLDDAKDSETNPRLVKERGMLALDLGQLEKAERLLTRARDDFEPDWRVHSALGATYSARGNQQAAQVEFSKALKLAPDHPSVLNNLALSYALDGNHDQAEQMLRRAASLNSEDVKTKQNLALILGLHGNVQEAQRVSRLVMPAEKADANAAYFSARKTKSATVSKASVDAPKPMKSAQVTQSAQP